MEITVAVCGYAILSIPINISYGSNLSFSQCPVMPIYPVLLLEVHKSVVIKTNSQELIVNCNNSLTPILYAFEIKSLIVLSQGMEYDGSSL